MSETVRNIQVLEQDAARLERLFGKPMKRAMHLALAKAGCEHPEGMRKYTTAVMRADEEAVNQREPEAPVITLSGFRCGACGAYIFPGQILEGA